MKRTHRILASLIIAGGISSIACPASANETTDSTNTNTFSLGDMLNTVGNIGGVFGVDLPNLGNLTTLGGLDQTTIDDTGGFSTENIETATQVTQNLKSIYSSVSSGNTNGILSGLEGLLGSLGLLSPSAASSKVSAEGVSSGSNTSVPSIEDAKSPAHAYFLSKVADSTYRDAVETKADTQLGTKGQTTLESQTKESSLALGVSQEAQKSLNTNLQTSIEATKSSLSGAQSSASAAKAAEAAVDSQTVLKQMSTQMALEAQQNAINSGHLTLLTSGQTYQSTQLATLQAQAKIQSDQLRNMQILSAAQVNAQSQIANLVDRQLQYEQNKDQQTVSGAAQSAASIYIPGYSK